jgi:hypothetical protein
MTEETMGIISLIFGILAFFIFGLIFGIIAIIFGALSMSTGLGKTGLILGIINVGIILLFLLMMV